MKQKIAQIKNKKLFRGTQQINLVYETQSAVTKLNKGRHQESIQRVDYVNQSQRNPKVMKTRRSTSRNKDMPLQKREDCINIRSNSKTAELREKRESKEHEKKQ